jgi:hypothetical protein
MYRERGDLRDKNLIACGLEPVFDTPEAFAPFLGQDRI